MFFSFVLLNNIFNKASFSISVLNAPTNYTLILNSLRYGRIYLLERFLSAALTSGQVKRL